MNDLLNQFAEYDDDKIAPHWQTPIGVVWSSAESQSLRFTQLSKVVPETGSFTLNNLGCGCGALFEFSEPQYPQITCKECGIKPDMASATYKKGNGVDYTSPTDFFISASVTFKRMWPVCMTMTSAIPR